MSTGYGWEDICATLLGARHVPERLRGGSVYTWGAIQVLDLYLFTFSCEFRTYRRRDSTRQLSRVGVGGVYWA